MSEDIRQLGDRDDPRGGSSGSGAAYERGYGAGGLSSGDDRTDHGHSAQNANTWDAPGVTPEGHRTGSSQEGPRIAMDGEAEPDPEADEGQD